MCLVEGLKEVERGVSLQAFGDRPERTFPLLSQAIEVMMGPLRTLRYTALV